ncbi:putative necrosis-inducing factor-domain-containing protein [Biscogniauxia mediterranea]|nr:putative necrosis-inducing factor-domain-containing protein [Biscogniauxia mediterranea]
MQLIKSIAIFFTHAAVGTAVPTPEKGIEFITSSGAKRTVYVHVPLASAAEAEVVTEEPGTSKAKRFQFHADSEDRNFCGVSSFEDRTSGGSPGLSDCECVRDWSAAHKGYYSINKSDSDSFFPVITCGTCRFGVDTSNFFGTHVGNKDIVDVVDTALGLFPSGGRVGAYGEMGCDNSFVTAGTRWGLYRS